VQPGVLEKPLPLSLQKKARILLLLRKSVTEDPRLGGTIYSAAAEVEAAGGKCLAVQVDIRFEDQIEAAIAKSRGNIWWHRCCD
jgi:citronellol/citronellal dehydrogenase